MFAEYFDGADDIIEHVESWNDLALHSSDPNPFFESWCLLPALRRLESDDVQILVVWEDDSRQTMLGLIPIVVERKYRGLPIKRTTIWRHSYCFLSTPLIAKNRVAEVLGFMLNNIGERKSWPSFVSMYWLANESEVTLAVTGQSIAGFDPKGELHTTSRAMVSAEGDYESTFLPTLNKKKRKELRRNKNRLSELGDLKTVLVDKSLKSSDIDNAIQRFIKLENQGWKRDQGTAIACNKEHQCYFEESLLEGIRNGGAYIVSMTLDGNTIASVIIIKSAPGSHAYTVKIASEAQYQQYSLGSLLILETTELAFENSVIRQIDSCAASEHPMINRIWRERKDIVNINITPSNDYLGALIPFTDYCVGLARKLQSVKT